MEKHHDRLSLFPSFTPPTPTWMAYDGLLTFGGLSSATQLAIVPTMSWVGCAKAPGNSPSFVQVPKDGRRPVLPRPLSCRRTSQPLRHPVVKNPQGLLTAAGMAGQQGILDAPPTASVSLGEVMRYQRVGLLMAMRINSNRHKW